MLKKKGGDSASAALISDGIYSVFFYTKLIYTAFLVVWMLLYQEEKPEKKQKNYSNKNNKQQHEQRDIRIKLYDH